MLLLSCNQYAHIRSVLVYASTPTHSLNASEIATLFQKCRKNNHRNGITGLLLYSNGQFIQLVEGHETDVLLCYEKICHDPRHTGVLRLVQKPCADGYSKIADGDSR